MKEQDFFVHESSYILLEKIARYGISAMYKQGQE